MSPMHYFQLFIFSVCINSFSLFIYVIYYGDLLLSYNDELQQVYDYIIVGSGTAGSLIAHRIATETNFTFVVVEAGGKSHALFDIPVLGPLLHGSMYDWQYETVPQNHACLAMKNKKCKLTQGKIIGGSSKLNNMVHVRGNISHYVDWFHGKHSEEYIKKQFEFLERKLLSINKLLYQSELADAVIKAAKELGYKVNEENDDGFMISKLNQKNGKRWSTSDNLENRHIITNALVSKILIKNNAAYGVEVVKSGRKVKSFARKGVIISAGTYNTPKLLQLSGIGPKKLLKSLGIPIVKDLPVGDNLQEHVATGLDLVLFNESLTVNAMNVLNPKNLYHYFLNGQGAFTSPGCEAVGFISTKNETSPNLQFMVLPVGISSDRGSHLRQSINVQDDVWDKYFVKIFDKHSATILPIVLHPKSKGTVYVNSKDPEKPPLIDPNYFASQEDLDVLRNGLKIILKLVSTKAIKKIGGYINRLPLPGCEKYDIFSDIYWDCYVRHLTLTSYHPIGTCSMGLSGLNSVVDTSFQVLGLSRLYVADGSVLPTLPSGNINAAIAMMASVFFDTKIVNHDNVCYAHSIYEYIYDICI